MSSMILNERIKTTEAKAKAIKGEVEKLVTRAKKGKKDLVSGSIYPNAFDKLFNDIARRFEGRAGGYTRIVKIGQRFGDRASLVVLEWVEGPAPALAVTKEPRKAKVKKVKTVKNTAKPKKKVTLKPKKAVKK